MNRLIHFAAWVVVSGATAQAQETIRLDEGIPRSVSSSRQFVVYGATLDVRAIYVELAEDLKSSLLALLNGPDTWRYPVVIRLFEAPGGVAGGALIRSSASEIEGTLRFSLAIRLTRELSEEMVKRKLLELLLFEYTLRIAGRDGIAKADKLRIPPWMIDGMLGASRLNATGRTDRFFRQLFGSGRTLNIPEILEYEIDGKTSVQRLAFRASATGLVLALLDQPEGTQKFHGMLRDLLDFDSQDEAALLVRFPELGATPEAMEKWWSLELAVLSEPGPLDILTIVETEAELQKALFASIPFGAGESQGERKRWLKWLRKEEAKPVSNRQNQEPTALVPLEEIDALLRIKEDKRKGYLASNKTSLMHLSFRSFPLYRPIIKEYLEAVEKLMEGERRGLAERLETLTQKRQALLRADRDVEELLYWTEVNQPVRDPSRFSDLYRAHEELDQPLPLRNDPLSKYLDSLEKEWED